jgi:hypothetical protein
MFVLSSTGDADEGLFVYSTGFDTLLVGETTAYPGGAGQDGWYSAAAVAPAYGEIQETIANTGRALHQYVDDANLSGAQKIDRREISTPPDLSQNPIVTLEVDFYCHTSDLSQNNPYAASIKVEGGPHPGYVILGFGLNSGNGPVKSDAGVNVSVSYFNGADNNDVIPLTVGQGLAWDGWHSLTLVINQAEDTYVSLMVDGQGQDLTGYALPRSNDEGTWRRGELIEAVTAEIVSQDFGETSTSDDVYWDNLELRMRKVDLVSACDGDYDKDGDVDGDDLWDFMTDSRGVTLADFASEFGRSDCL